MEIQNVSQDQSEGTLKQIGQVNISELNDAALEARQKAEAESAAAAAAAAAHQDAVLDESIDIANEDKEHANSHSNYGDTATDSQCADTVAMSPPALDESFLFDDEREGVIAGGSNVETLAEAISRGPEGFGLEIRVDGEGRACLGGVRGAAQSSALRTGDVILSVNGEKTPSREEVMVALRGAGEDALLTIQRDTNRTPFLSPPVIIDMET